jgi:hypothetical protein
MNNEYRLKNNRILFWNADSLRAKQFELLELVTHYQLILFSFGHLKEGNKYQIPKNTSYRCDRMASKKGGVAILAEKGIQHTELI